jgi:hypothetical protein
VRARAHAHTRIGGRRGPRRGPFQPASRRPGHASRPGFGAGHFPPLPAIARQQRSGSLAAGGKPDDLLRPGLGRLGQRRPPTSARQAASGGRRAGPVPAAARKPRANRVRSGRALPARWRARGMGRGAARLDVNLLSVGREVARLAPVVDLIAPGNWGAAGRAAGGVRASVRPRFPQCLRAYAPAARGCSDCWGLLFTAAACAGRGRRSESSSCAPLRPLTGGIALC